MKPFAWKPLRQGLLVFAILHQTLHHYFLSSDVATFGSDKQWQVAGAYSLLHGTGLAVAHADPSNLSRTLPEPLLGWPPAYSWLLAPLIFLTGEARLAAFLLDALSITVFFAGWYLVLEQCGDLISDHARNRIWILWAFVYNPLLTDTSTGILCQALLALGLLAMVHGLHSTCNPNLTGTRAGFAMAATAYCRFSYWPLLAAPPLAMLVLARRQPKVTRVLVAYCTVTTIALGALFVYRIRATGHLTYLGVHYGTLQPIIHWENLRRAIPFPIYALGFHRSLPKLVEALHLPPQLYTMVATMLAAIMLTAFAVFCGRGIAPVLCRTDRSSVNNGPEGAQTTDRRQRLPITSNPFVHSPLGSVYVATFGAAVVMATAAMLYYLSLKYPAIEIRGEAWTHVEEARFYGPSYAFLTIGFAALLPPLRSRPRHRVRWPLARVCVVGIMGLLLMATTCWRLANWRYSLASRAKYQAIEAFYSAIQEKAKHNPQLVVISDDPHELRLAAAAGARVLSRPAIDLSDLSSSQPVEAILCLAEPSTASSGDKGYTPLTTDVPLPDGRVLMVAVLDTNR